MTNVNTLEVSIKLVYKKPSKIILVWLKIANKWLHWCILTKIKKSKLLSLIWELRQQYLPNTLCIQHALLFILSNQPNLFSLQPLHTNAIQTLQTDISLYHHLLESTILALIKWRIEFSIKEKTSTDYVIYFNLNSS